MSKNCLLTKLVGTVNNNLSPYFGEISFTVDDKDGNHDPILRVNSDSNMVIETVSGTFKDGTTSKEYTAGTSGVYYTTRGAVVRLHPAYEITYFVNGFNAAYTLDTSIFKYANKLEEVQIFGYSDKVTGKFSDFANSASTLKSLNVRNTNRIYTIDELITMPNLEALNINNPSTNLISTSQFATKFPSLKALYNVLLSGNISDFSYMIANGMTVFRSDSSYNNLTGNLSSLIGASNCEITLPASKTVETTQATLDTLTAAGCTVTNYKLIE